MKTKSELLVLLDQSHSELQTYLQQLDAEKELYPGWRTQELLAHLTGWDQIGCRAIEAQVLGQGEIPVTVLDFDGYNQTLVDTYSHLNLEQMIDVWGKQRQELKALVVALSEAQLMQTMPYPWGESGSVAELAEGLVEHEQYHLLNLSGEL